jgi:RHS repeat-associated protein
MRYQGIFIGFLLIFSLLLKLDTFAGTEPYKNTLRGKLRTGDTLLLRDTRFRNPHYNWNDIRNIWVKDAVTFRLSDQQLVSKDFMCTAALKVEYLKDPAQLVPTVENIQLRINYSVKKGAVYKMMDSYSFSGAFWVRITVQSIASPELGSDLPPAFELGGDILINRKYKFNPKSLVKLSATVIGGTTAKVKTGSISKKSTASPRFTLLARSIHTTSGKVNGGNQLQLYWGKDLSADEYDLEWTTVDSGNQYIDTIGQMAAGTAGTISDTLLNKIFLHNATRITTADTSYLVSLVSNDSYILVRIRNVQYNPANGIRLLGAWDYSLDGSGYAVWGLNWYQDSLNWQYSAAFAEEGKKKEVVSYFDGTLRGRQTVTINNSDNVAVAQENVYDEFGRATASILPAPHYLAGSVLPYLQYFKNLNLNGLDSAYNSDNVKGATSDSCEFSPDSLKADSGASLYYSHNNPYLTATSSPNYKLYNFYIPDAAGFPLSVTQYTADNTGRIKLQGGVGKLFQPGDEPSKTTKYYYGKPEQWELDQLFGNDVGYASHYLKNMVVDPNGQISISYINASGKTIATALTGTAPSTMDSLTSSVPVTRKTIDLLDSSKFVFDASALKISATTTYLASLADAGAVLHYSVKKLIDHYPGGTHPICSNCYYDLNIQVFDDCNKQIYNNTTPIKIGSDTSACDSTGTQVGTLPLDFPQIGEYYITFNLNFSKTVMENYTSNFITKGIADSTLAWEFDYLLPYLNGLDFKSCLSDCSTCQQVLGSRTQFTNAIENKLLALDVDTASVNHGAFSTWIHNQYTTLKAYCDSLHANCNADTASSSPCEQYMQPMLDDVSPGGQYALFDTTYNPLDTANNILFKHWRTEFPATAKTDTTIYNSALITLPNGTITSAYDSTFNVKLLAQYWNDDWAQRFLQYHPEYCKLKFCWANEASEYWDQTVQDSILTAGAIGLIPNAPPGFHYDRSNAAWLVAADPFFRSGGAGADLATAFESDLDNYTKNALGATTVSTKSLTGFIDFLLYCSDPTASTNTLNNPLNNWDNCVPSDSCRVIDREWASYKQYYFALKQQYYTKVRANTTCANNCQVGVPASLPTNSACPAVSDFTINDYSSADGAPTDSCGSGTKLVTLAYVPGNVLAKVKVSISYAQGTNTTGLPTSFTFKLGQRDTMFCVPGGIPSSSMTVISAVCDSCKVSPLVFNTWANAYIKQTVYDTSGTVISTRTIHVDSATLFPGTLTINPDNTYNVVTTFHPYSGSWEQNDSCQFALYSNGVRYLLSAVSADSLSLTHREGNIQETWHYGSVSSSVTCTSPDVINVASLKSSNVYYQGSYPTRHIITVIPGISGTTPPFTCINATGDTSTSTSAFHTCLNVITADSITFKYHNVWVFNCVYDNVPSGCSPTLLTKQSEFNDTYTQPVIGDTSTVVNQNKSALSGEIKSSCVANADGWMTTLRPGLGSYGADTALLRAHLVAICEAGGDINHPFGASTVAPGQTGPGGINSFAAAIAAMTGSSTFTPKLNPWLITAPYPYSPRQQGTYTTISNTSPAICNILTNLQHQCDSVNIAHGTSLTLYQYLLQTYGDAMILSAGDVDSLKKSCNNCRFILPYDVALPVFMDPLSKGCIMPFEYKTAKSALQTAFNHHLTADSANYQAIYANFMNQRWGFTLSYDQYQAYDDTLAVDSTRTLCNTITSVAPPTDSLACIESQIATAVGNGKASYAAYLNQQKDLFRASYVNTCSAAAANVNLTTNQKIYHYTLYYYDQADNLVRTIPPEGIALLDSAQISLVDRSRNNNPLDCNYTGPGTNANKTTAFNALSTTLSATTAAIEFWLYEDGTTQNHLVEITPDKKYLFQLSIADSILAIDIYPAGASGTTGITFNPASIHYRADISSQLPLDPFTHVVLQGDSLGTANSAQLYVNGMAFTATKVNTSAGPGFTVGSTGTGIVAPDSIQTLKHLRLYSQLLSTGVIAANAANTCFMPTDSSHMTGWYRFNVPSPGGPTTINDTSTVETRLPAVYPQHGLLTKYAYNSTNQVSTQNSPDGGTNRFWYDLLSRLVISENDKQLADTDHSYTKYDSIGRITEVGQNHKNTVSLGNPDYLSTSTINNFYAAGSNNQITNTYYDTVVMAGNGIQNVGQTNIAMRKRVSLTTYRSTQADTVTQATYYDYDLDGNVKNLYQQVAGLGIKRLYYEYDLISGKVNFLAYQNGKNDRFYYQYIYDADNRVTGSWSSIAADTSTYFKGSTLDPTQKRLDASYQYYLHGPLARMELGDSTTKVQGVDYAYTLQGWLKGVNSQILRASLDMGHDSLAVAKDAYGYSLGYYHNDFKPIGGSSYVAFANQYTQNIGDITGQNLYNGNISTSTVAISALNSGRPVGYTYHYDQLNRIKLLRQHSSIATASWNQSDTTTKYHENFTYDGNGNILSLLRIGDTSSSKDNLAYQYNRDVNGRLTNNKLNWLNGVGNATQFGTPQYANNYRFDPIGNMTYDRQDSITNVSWSVYNKIQAITDSGKTIAYVYNTAQERVAKTANSLTTYYVRDAQGNTIALYDNKSGHINWREQHLYGSSRLGLWLPNVNVATDSASFVWDTVGRKRYELNNHLGNVLTTITDKQVVDTTGLTHYYTADISTAQDYYAFGALMPGRMFGTTSYRYGFNGKENDNEVKGVGNQQDYGMRIYDPRVGRFLSVDPLQTKYPELTPYQFAGNTPISAVDLDGKEPKIVVSNQPTGYTQIFVYGYNDVHETVVQTYKAMVQYTDTKGQTTTLGTFNVTRDGWYGMGTDKNGNNIFVNRSSDQADNAPLIIESHKTEQYGKGTPSYTISEIFSPIPKEYNQGPIKMGVITPDRDFTSEVLRANGSSDRYAKFHVGGWFIGGKDEGSYFGKLKLGGTYGCFGIVDPTQISQYTNFTIDPNKVIPSNSETKRFGTAVEEAKKLQIKEHRNKAPVQVKIQKRHYEKVRILKPGKLP